MSENKTFYVWNKETKKYCKAVWNKDLPDSGIFSQENVNSLPQKTLYADRDLSLWVFTPVIGLREKWWIEQVEWWEKNNIVLPPEEPYGPEPGFWAIWDYTSNWRWIILKGERSATAYMPDGGVASSGVLKDIAKINGYILPPNISTEGKEVEKTAQQLQDDLIEYCAKKSSRIPHLQELTRLGALDRSISYGKLAQTITDYLDNTNGICSEGRVKAKTALGLENKIVVKQLTCSEILDGIGQGKNYYFVDKQGRKVTTEHKSSHYMYIPREWLGSINYSAVLTVGVEE